MGCWWTIWSGDKGMKSRQTTGKAIRMFTLAWVYSSHHCGRLGGVGHGTYILVSSLKYQKKRARKFSFRRRRFAQWRASCVQALWEDRDIGAYLGKMSGGEHEGCSPDARHVTWSRFPSAAGPAHPAARVRKLAYSVAVLIQRRDAEFDVVRSAGGGDSPFQNKLRRAYIGVWPSWSMVARPYVASVSLAYG